MPKATSTTIYQQQQCKFDVPARRFCVEFGYKEGNVITMEFRDGDMVYLGDVRDSRYPDKWLSACVPFKVFAEAWPRFVQFIATQVDSA